MTSPSPGYEFTESQNHQVSGLAQLMRFFAYSLFLGGALQALLICVFMTGALQEGITALPRGPMMVTVVGGLVGMYLAMGLITSSRNFMEIVHTQGSDIDHLMAALSKLRGFFLLSGVLLWVLVVMLLGVTAWSFLSLGDHVTSQVHHFLGV